MLLLQEEGGGANIYLVTVGKGVQKPGPLASTPDISEEPSQIQDSPWETLRLHNSTFPVLILLPSSFLDLLPRSLPNQFPERKSLPQSLFLG